MIGITLNYNTPLGNTTFIIYFSECVISNSDGAGDYFKNN